MERKITERYHGLLKMTLQLALQIVLIVILLSTNFKHISSII